MTVFAVFDTNVIVSAMITPNSDAPTVKVLEMVANGRIQAVGDAVQAVVFQRRLCADAAEIAP